MGLSIGIVGLPNVGKSTLFNALTKQSVPAENYPFCTINPSVGVVAVPDPRLTKLSEFSKSGKTVPAAVEFVDIAGLVAGAAAGEGLGNKFLSHIREVDAIAHVVRVFEDPDVIHVANKIDPKDDIEIVNLELRLADEESIAKRGEKKAKKGEVLPPLNLLREKPTLYVLNTSGASENVEVNSSAFAEASADKPVRMVKVDPIFGTGLDDLIKASYDLLGLITFFTTGADETRAWTIKRGSPAPIAGMAIHTDFRDKFIRAEVINWQKLLEGGRPRTEGKEYVVRDGDVIEFKI